MPRTARIVAASSKPTGMGTCLSDACHDDRFTKDRVHLHGDVLGDGATVARLRDLVDELFTDTAADLPDAVGWNADDDAGVLPDEIGGSHVRGCLLPVEE